MRLIKPFEILFLLGVLLVATCVSAWLAFWSPDALLRDPLPLYRQGEERSSPEIIADRQIHQYRLVGPDNETVRFRVSLPEKLPLDPLPVVMIVGGFPGEPNILRHVPHPGANAIVTYHPPFDPNGSILASFPFGGWDARRIIYRMPEEVSAILAWTARQEWADRKRVNLVGVGLGAAILPAIRRRAGATGRQVNATVFIGGGTNLWTLADANLDIGWSWPRAVAAGLVNVMLNPLAPETHLPEISGPFLLVNLPDNPAVPEETRIEMEALMPSPKTAATVPRGDGTDDAYIGRVVRVVQNWLIAQGAINP